MDQTYYRGVFSWPTLQWHQQDRENVSPRSLGVDIIQHSALEQLSTLVDDAVIQGRDESVAIFDLGVVVNQFLLWKKTFPSIQPFYAMKAHDDPVVISVLASLGAGVDCASKNEIDIALKCGVVPQSIIFASTVKFPSHLRFAKTNDVTLMTVDNEEEMYKIQEYAPKSKLLVRMAPLSTSKVQIALSVKFGCSREGATRLVKLACQLDLDVVGISFHVGSGCSNPQNYVNHIKAARQLFDDAEAEGFKLNLLDLGGGLFGNVEAEPHLKEIAGPIKETLEELFPESSGVKVIAEPGRYFVESALYLATCVIGKRPAVNEQVQNLDAIGMLNDDDETIKGPEFYLNGVQGNPPPGAVAFEKHPPGEAIFEKGPPGEAVFEKRPPGEAVFEKRPAGEAVFEKRPPDEVGFEIHPPGEVGFEYYISEAVYGLLSIHLYSKGYQYNVSPLKIESHDDAPTYSSKLWGASLDSVDLVTKCCKLPELYIGDWLVFKDVGAYSVVLGGTFNAIPKPSIHRVIEQSMWDKLLDAIIDTHVTLK